MSEFWAFFSYKYECLKTDQQERNSLIKRVQVSGPGVVAHLGRVLSGYAKVADSISGTGTSGKQPGNM